MKEATVHLTCRVCPGKLNTVFDLGYMIPSSFDGQQEKYPLELTRCDRCSLVQLRHTVSLDMMYREYWYRSALNATMIRHLKGIADSIIARTKVGAGDVIIDIGCNDGTLLSFFPEGTIKWGYDPALNLAEDAERVCDVFVNDYFTVHNGPKARVITAIAMFYDLEDPHSFLNEVKRVLCKGGTFVVEMTDLFSIMKKNAFDSICHEHLEIYSLQVFANLLDGHDLMVYDLKHNEMNGGSIRLFCCHKGERSVRPPVSTYMDMEVWYFSNHGFNSFAARVNEQRRRTLAAINREILNGRQVFALGASTKGATLLQYFGINKKMLPYALEIHPDKIGKEMVQGTQIIHEDRGLDMNPGALLVLPWHYKEFFIDVMEPYMRKGGKLIFPLPEVDIWTL